MIIELCRLAHENMQFRQRIAIAKAIVHLCTDLARYPRFARVYETAMVVCAPGATVGDVEDFGEACTDIIMEVRK